MGADLFAPWHIIILLVVVLVLFGAKRLPGAAQSLGQSMHIFRRSVKGLDADAQASQPGFSAAPASPAPPASPPAAITPAPDATQQQIADLQRQLNDLQSRAGGAAVTDTPVPQTQHPQQ